MIFPVPSFCPFFLPLHPKQPWCLALGVFVLSLCFFNALICSTAWAQAQPPTTIRGWLDSFMAQDPAHFTARTEDLIKTNPGLRNQILDEASVVTFERDLSLHPERAQQLLTQYSQTYPRVQDRLTTLANPVIAQTPQQEGAENIRSARMVNVGQAGSRFDNGFLESPWFWGGAALATGAGVGLALALSGDDKNDNNATPPAQQDPAVFQTPEYKAQHGLGDIHAANAYARGGSGSGITVAVIDTGLDASHPDFSGRLAAGGFDFLNNTGAITETDTTYSHGTHVAGVIAANRNNVGMHGVAWDAKILPLAAIGANPPAGAVVNAINLARVRGAQVLNASFGPAMVTTQLYEFVGAQLFGDQTQLEAEAYKNATAQGMVLVFAAGNGHDAKLTPLISANPTGGGFLPFIRPANAAIPLGAAGAYRGLANNGAVYVMTTADYSALEPLTLAVVSVDRANTITTYSNRCGVAKNWCVAAPGIDIYSTSSGGKYTALSGTSFAAPHVAGAVAVLRQMFPELSPAQIVDILKTSATDLGAPGVDDVYGYGLINLEAATRPLNGTRVALDASVEGRSLPLDNSSLNFGAAFGAQAGRTLANSELGFLDGYARNYVLSLRPFVQGRTDFYDSAAALQRFVRPDDHAVYQLRRDTTVSFSLKARDNVLPISSDRQKELDQGPDLASFTLDHGVTDKTSLALRHHDVQSVGLLFRPEDHDRLTARIMQNGLSNPYLGFTGDGYAQSVTMDLTEATRLRMTTAIGKSEGNTDQRNIAAMAELATDVRKDIVLALSFGVMQEQDRVLGMKGAGAFALGQGTPTLFAGAEGKMQLADHLALRGAAWFGLTTPESTPSSLVRGMSGLTTSAFNASLERDTLFADGDKLTLGLSQPLRVESGTMDVSLPLYRLSNGAILRRDLTQTLTPSGRELDFELNYTMPLNENSGDVAFGALWRKDASHVTGAEEGIALARYNRKF